MAGSVLLATRVAAPLLIALALLRQGLRRGTVTSEEYEQRMAWLRLVAIVGAALFGLLAAVALVAAITGAG